MKIMASDIKLKYPNIGYIMKLELALMSKYAEELMAHPSPQNVERAKIIVDSLTQYKEHKISFKTLFNILRENGFDHEEPQTIADGVDYATIAQYDEVCSISKQDVRRYYNGYSFDGEPAHPELFSIENVEAFPEYGIEKHKEGEFKYSIKLQGQKFKFVYNTRRSEETDEYFVLVGKNPGTTRDIKLLDRNDEIITNFLNENKLKPLSIFYDIAEENSMFKGMKYDEGYAENGEMVVINKTIRLTNEEFAEFVKYCRAFKEAMEGKGEFTKELNEISSRQKSGCMGMLIIPIIALLGTLSWLIYM